MNPAPYPAVDREARLESILLAYVEAEEAGQAPDRETLLDSYPEFAEDLTDFLAGQAEVEHLAEPLRRLAAASIGDSRLSKTAPAVDGEGKVGWMGDFRLLREVGSGGMGVVYEAEQLSLHRRVALKVLSFAAALNPKQLQRFKNEAQAAAQLRHPNIVPVFAVGCERGVHYYVMQFIEGQSLAALIKELGLVRGGGSTQLSYGGFANASNRPYLDKAINLPAEPTVVTAQQSTKISLRKSEHYHRVARLARTAAEALEHAHQVGVVHRDIKPANLLLDSGGNLWITDFGLALVRGDCSLTLSGELVGTLRYMSPEQASARPGLVDHRTDVYSLGVTLYELLTLQPLIQGEGRQELLQRVSSEEPLPPRHWDPGIPAELETIVLKAIAKVPSERYNTAQDMADDLGRYLEDRPILAKRPTLIDRARKWGRRHKSLVVSAVVLMSMAVVGLVATTVLLAQETAKTRAAYQKERLRAKEALDARTLAEENLEKTRWAVDFFSGIGEDQLAKSLMHQGVRRPMLEFALRYYQDFIDQCQNDPRLQAELKESRARVERILGELRALEWPLRLKLLQQLPVQKELKLTPDQLGELQGLIAELEPAMRESWKGARPKPVIRPLAASTAGLLATPYGQGPFLVASTLIPGRKVLNNPPLKEQKRRKELLEFAEIAEAADLLTKEQDCRLSQIVLQMKAHGPQGFSDPEVSTLLKLTAAQKEHIPGFYQLPAKGPMSGKALHDYYDQSLKMLTAEQRQRWHELTGEPVVGLRFIESAGPDGFKSPLPGPFGIKPKSNGPKPPLK